MIMKGEQIRIWWERVMAYLKVLSWTDWGKPHKPLVRLASNMSKIWTRYLQNINLAHYQYIMWFRVFIMKLRAEQTHKMCTT